MLRPSAITNGPVFFHLRLAQEVGNGAMTNTTCNASHSSGEAELGFSLSEVRMLLELADHGAVMCSESVKQITTQHLAAC